jgi:hypothetical protein
MTLFIARRKTYTALLLAFALLPSCGDSTSPSATTATASALPAPPPTSTPAPSASEAPTATASATAAEDAGAPSPPPKEADYDPLNKAKPLVDSEELQSRARALFEAIVQNSPARAEDLWFPREPFLILKDIKDPGKYWDQLHRTYAADIRALHKKRKSWDGASFVSFAIGSKPKWVKPGDEANKIGYYRSFHGTLRYAIDGKEGTLDVHTVITWQGRWYITHLRKFKK